MQEETQTLLKKPFVRDCMVHAGKASKIAHISQYYSIFSQIFSLEIIRYPIIPLIFLCHLSYYSFPPLYGFCVLETLIVDGFVQPDLY